LSEKLKLLLVSARYTLIYTQLVEFEDNDQYCTAVANNVEEARKLLESGFEYVCRHKDEMLFRKRKQRVAEKLYPNRR